MTQFPIKTEGATPLTPEQREQTLAFLRRRIADAGRRAERARTDAFHEDAQRDIAKFARQLAAIASQPAGRVPSSEV